MSNETQIAIPITHSFALCTHNYEIKFPLYYTASIIVFYTEMILRADNRQWPPFFAPLFHIRTFFSGVDIPSSQKITGCCHHRFVHGWEVLLGQKKIRTRIWWSLKEISTVYSIYWFISKTIALTGNLYLTKKFL